MPELFTSQAERKGLTLLTCVDDKVPELIHSDPSIIRQILLNLLANAIRFTKSGQITIATSLKGEDVRDVQLMFSVNDTGVGIDEDKLPRLLTPFAPVSPAPDGTAGTGLVLCKRLIELLHGDIGCTSRKGQGSTFWFTLCASAADAPEAEKSDYSHLFDRAELAACRVLSVDDSPVVSRLTTRQLGIIGVQSEAATTGKQAIEKAKTGRFDLILMDVHLPDMTGYEAARKIREAEQSGELSRAIIIALTGCATEEYREQAASAGMDDFLSKPVSIALLREHLLKALAARRAPNRPEHDRQFAQDQDTGTDLFELE